MAEITDKEVAQPLSIGVFAIVTLIYSVLIYIASPALSSIIKLIYFSTVVIMAFTVNSLALKSQCNDVSIAALMISTIVPWTLIFGVLNIMFKVMAGWKAPFANTFGYMACKALGIKKLMNELRPPTDEKAVVGEASQTRQIINMVYRDESLIINEVTPENFDNFWGKMTEVGAFKNDEALKARLLGFVKLKSIVSEFIWYMLSGALVIAISFNYVINYSCH